MEFYRVGARVSGLDIDKVKNPIRVVVIHLPDAIVLVREHSLSLLRPRLVVRSARRDMDLYFYRWRVSSLDKGEIGERAGFRGYQEPGTVVFKAEGSWTMKMQCGLRLNIPPSCVFIM